MDNARGIQFYIGAPLRDENGTVVGALYAFDEKPRQIITNDDRTQIIKLKKKAKSIINDISNKYIISGV